MDSDPLLAEGVPEVSADEEFRASSAVPDTSVVPSMLQFEVEEGCGVELDEAR